MGNDAKQDTGTGADRPAGMSGWFQELRRRHIFKVTIAYLVLAWLLMQVAALLETSLGLPKWTDKFTFAILLIGFPIALFVTWAVDLSPEEKLGNNGKQSAPAKSSSNNSDNVGISNTILPEAKDQKSSIAVLPFENISGDPSQDYIGEGLASDIIAGISRIKTFFVISRNSSFQYKGKSSDVRQVAKELDVRYLLEGTVQKIGERLRLSIQLVDGRTGHALWNERYDREFTDLFNIQDELTTGVVARLGPELTRAEYERVKNLSPHDLNAWELFHRASTLSSRKTTDDSEQAISLLQKALEIDPKFAPAHSLIGYTMAHDLLFRLADRDPQTILYHGRKAVELDDSDPFSWFGLAWGFYYTRKWDDSIDAFRRAVSLNPNFSNAHACLGRGLIHSGQVEDGIDHVERACELSPLDRAFGMWLYVIADGHLYRGRYDLAAERARESIRYLDRWIPWMVLTSALGHMGDRHAIDEAISETRKRKPNFSINQADREYLVSDRDCKDKLLKGLRLAGVPEEAPSET